MMRSLGSSWPSIFDGSYQMLYEDLTFLLCSGL